MYGETDPLEQIDLDVDSASLVPFQSSTFKAPKRITHLPDDDQHVQSSLKPRPDPCHSQLPASKRSRTFQPGSSAIPLDDQRYRNSIPPAITAEECRKSREPVASKLSEAVSTRGDFSEANGNANEQSLTVISELVPFNASLPTQQVARALAKSQEPLRRFLPITENMLTRVCNWNYSWITKQNNLNELPPVLDAVFTLPKLFPVPVRTDYYTSIAEYQDTFFPLMLHEIWGCICKNVENTVGMWRAKAILHENVSSDGMSAFVRCEALVPKASPCLREYDLIVLSFAVKNEQIREVFGVVEGVSQRNYDESIEIDKRLHLSCRNPLVLVNFTLRMKPSNVPEDRSQLLVDIRCVTSLEAQVKQFSMVAELPNTPLYDVIMDPTRNPEAFTLIEEAPEVSCLSKPNEIQQQAIISISSTVLQTKKKVPKVAMLKALPGTGKSHVIVQLVLRLLSQYYAEKKKMPKILVCAPSNSATDEIALRLINTVDYEQGRMMVVRVGKHSAIHPNVKEITVEALVKAKHEQLVAERESCKSYIEMAVKELEILERIRCNFNLDLEDAMKSGDRHYVLYVERDTQEIKERIEAMEETKKKLEKELDEELARPFHSELLSTKEEIIGEANVICTTLNSCRSTDMESVFLQSKGKNEDSEILCCIIDDASQCTEPESLTPLGLGISKLILIGDPDQLPAMVCSRYAQRLKFDQSLFNRFFLARRSLILPTIIRTNNN